MVDVLEKTLLVVYFFANVLISSLLAAQTQEQPVPQTQVTPDGEVKGEPSSVSSNAKPTAERSDSGVNRVFAVAEPDVKSESWFVLLEGKQIGPFSSDEIVSKIKSGEIKFFTPVSPEEKENWVSAKMAFPKAFADLDTAKDGGEKAEKQKRKSGQCGTEMSFKDGKVYYLGTKVESHRRLSKIFKEYGPRRALGTYRSSRVLYWHSVVFSVAGGGLIGASTGYFLANDKEFTDETTGMLIVGGALIVTAIVFVLLSESVLKEAAEQFNCLTAAKNERRIHLAPFVGFGTSPLGFSVRF